MVTVNRTNGDYEIFDIGNNTILAADALGQVGPEWQVAGFGRFFGWRFFYDFFFWLVFAQLFCVPDSLLLARISLFDPLRQLDACVCKQFYDTRSWLSTVIEVLLSRFSLNVSFFGVGVVGANVGDNAAARRVAL